MQRLEFANKIKNNKNQKTEQSVEELGIVENKREGHGLNIALTRNVLYLLGSKDTYYVQSERSNNTYYFVKFKPDVFEWCSCPDNSMRHVKCKHLFFLNRIRNPKKYTERNWTLTRKCTEIPSSHNFKIFV